MKGEIWGMETNLLIAELMTDAELPGETGKDGTGSVGGAETGKLGTAATGAGTTGPAAMGFALVKAVNEHAMNDSKVI